jgi:hypothetical protein
MKSEPPDPSLPRVETDFNACGWSGAPDDNCYYVFDRDALAPGRLQDGLRVFAYMDDGDGMVVGCQAVLERYGTRWRLRPDESTWWRGRLSGNAA